MIDVKDRTCLGSCTERPMLYLTQNKTCKPCHILCAEGCTGPVSIYLLKTLEPHQQTGIFLALQTMKTHIGLHIYMSYQSLGCSLIESVDNIFIHLFEKRDVLCYGVWRPSVRKLFRFRLTPPTVYIHPAET